MRVSNVAVSPGRFRTAWTRTKGGLKKVFANPHFHMGKVAKYGGVFFAVTAFMTEYLPGLIPCLGVGIVFEGGRQVRNFVASRKAAQNIDTVA